MGCEPKKIFKRSALTERLLFQDGQTKDIIAVILEMDAEADRFVNKEAAQCLQGSTQYETLRNVWNFVKRNVTYKADNRGKEVVKSPAALFEIGRGDCKSFSIAEAALLRSLGFKGIRYRFAAYGSSTEVSHVYIVVKLSGKDVILDAVHSRFDDEVSYNYKKDISAFRGNFSSVGSLPPEPQTRKKATILALILLAWGITK
jgi:predicted transglutaminase-like cysteine proteinase